MNIDVITLFPKMFDGIINDSIIKRAIDNEKVSINLVDLRDFSTNKHNKVDDYQFGGGSGMVLMVEPVYLAIKHLKKENSKVVLLTPQGKTFNQQTAYEYKNINHLILVCGHYEGIDERILKYIDEEISIGDYILTGGEIPAMVLIDSVVRLLDGVIKEESHIEESFNNNLLDYPAYTKPREFMGSKVPDVLLSGNHKDINEWRLEQRIKKTKEKRPDLLKGE